MYSHIVRIIQNPQKGCKNSVPTENEQNYKINNYFEIGPIDRSPYLVTSKPVTSLGLFLRIRLTVFLFSLIVNKTLILSDNK